MLINDSVTANIYINAPAEKVWQALTDKDMIKQYFFGTNAESDWQVGSQIRYTGNWDGKTYEDKGEVLERTDNMLKTSYWSSMSGMEDQPENYYTVTYRLQEKDNGTELTILQEGFKDEKSRDHSKGFWDMILTGMKELVEKQ